MIFLPAPRRGSRAPVRSQRFVCWGRSRAGGSLAEIPSPVRSSPVRRRLPSPVPSRCPAPLAQRRSDTRVVIPL